MIYSFYTRFNTKPFVGERNNGEYLIDPTGYIPSKRLIENMIYAGQALDLSRSEDYDFKGGDDLEYRKVFDLRRPDVDVSEFNGILRSIEDVSTVEGDSSVSESTSVRGDSIPESGSDSGVGTGE